MSADLFPRHHEYMAKREAVVRKKCPPPGYLLVSEAELAEALREAFDMERATSEGNAWNKNSREFVISRATAALAKQQEDRER